MTEPEFPPKNAFDIQVALKIIRHISSGIYRDRAGSLKELISNSFDAQATTVRIDTGYPRHDTIVISDDGFGIDGVTLRKAFSQVGLSLKVTNREDYEGPFHRPIVGRFGIGFLASAHISDEIWVRSYPRSQPRGIEARINLRPYFLYMDKIETFEDFKFGTVDWREIPKEPGKTGTRIELRGVREKNFHRTLTHEGTPFVRWPAKGYRERIPGSQMHQLVEKSQRRVGLLYVDRMRGREELVWHLGMSTPVRYLDEGPIRSSYLDGESAAAVAALRKKVESYNFQVWFDGIEVRKPILLPTYHQPSQAPEDPELPKDVLVSPINVEGKSARGRAVAAHGYLFYQPWRVVPAELRGLYPRIGGVGIGHTYENRFLSYLKGESPILRVQISGELYVDSGLDDALNLDRSGFMELDPEYQFLAEASGDLVRRFFQEAKKKHGQGASSRKAAKEAREREAAIRNLEQYLAGVGFKAKVELQPDADTSAIEPDFSKLSLYDSTSGFEVVIDEDQKQVVISSDSPMDILRSRLIIAVDRILLAHARDPVAARRAFAEQLQQLAATSGTEAD